MALRPDRRDLRIIGYYLGKVSLGLSLMMAAPVPIALLLREFNSATALAVGAGIAAAVGQVAEWRLATRAELTWAHGTVIVATAWLIGPLFAAVPLFLSGHVATFLDAWFEAMSGLTTSGLSVVQDLDHLSYSMSLYRHLTHFVGGQGIVIVVLSLLAAGGGVGTLFVAEGRDERITPSVVRTARFIFRVAGVYLVIGTAALFVALRVAGLDGWRSAYHAVTLFFAAFDTGGFGPTSQSIAYYHSAGVEAVIVVLMVAGTLSFGLHYQLWLGRWRELFAATEARALLTTMVGLTALTVFGLAASGAYEQPVGLLRKGFFTLVSAHSGTGFGVTSGTLFISDWGTLAPAAVVVAMALGGMAGSTAGGIKSLRIAFAVKGIVADVRRVLLPDAALVVSTYHSTRRRILRTPAVRAATVILLLYLLTYLAGAAVGLLYERWDITETLFESVSAAANVGLSVGIVAPDMPVGLQVTYILQMWLGRLEFVAALSLLGYVVALVRGRT
jgi:trk system potassium uptake protein